MAKVAFVLKDRHRQVLAMIVAFRETSGYNPSVREIRLQTGISSLSVVNSYLNQLIENGYLDRSGGRSRALRVCTKGYEALGVEPLEFRIQAIEQLRAENIALRQQLHHIHEALCSLIGYASASAVSPNALEPIGKP